VPGFGPEVNAVLQRAMAREPQDRYANVAELHRALVYALTGRRIRLSSSPGEFNWEVDTAEPVVPIATAPTRLATAPVRPRLSRRWLAIPAGLVVAAAVIVIVVATRTSATPTPPTATVSPAPTPVEPTPSPPPAPEMVKVTFVVTPASTRLELAGKPVQGDVELPRSSERLVLSASAPGYRAEQLDVIADHDRTVEIHLDAIKKPRGRQTRKPAKPGLVRGSEL
jgi:hypothetical protein